MDYDSKWSTNIKEDSMLELFLNFTLRRLFDIFNFQISIRAHDQHRAFATLQNELYRVVDYDSKWSTNI